MRIANQGFYLFTFELLKGLYEYIWAKLIDRVFGCISVRDNTHTNQSKIFKEKQRGTEYIVLYIICNQKIQDDLF